jgi:hypothetical protein
MLQMLTRKQTWPPAWLTAPERWNKTHVALMGGDSKETAQQRVRDIFPLS